MGVQPVSEHVVAPETSNVKAEQASPTLWRSDLLLLPAMCLLMLGLSAMGIHSRAPYWLADGLSLLTTFPLASYVLLSPSATEGRKRKVSAVIWRVAAASILMELGFLIASVVLYRQTMNPFAPPDSGWYGREGRSFVWCSIGSMAVNAWVVRRFYAFGDA